MNKNKNTATLLTRYLLAGLASTIFTASPGVHAASPDYQTIRHGLYPARHQSNDYKGGHTAYTGISQYQGHYAYLLAPLRYFLEQKPGHQPPVEPPQPLPPLTQAGSECLVGGSSVASGCVVTSQQPVLQIPGTGVGNVYIVDGSSPDQNNAWVSSAIVLNPSGACGGNTCYTVPSSAGLLPQHSYQWAFIPGNGGGNNLSWQGFTIDYLRAGREPTDTLGPLTVGLASATVQTTLQTQAVQTASGKVQIGLSHRSGYSGTPTGKPWFIRDPAGALPVGWVFTGVDANVPWVRISMVDAVGGSGTSAVALQAFDGSQLEYTNANGGSGGWAPPVGVGKPANDYGTLTQSVDGNSFTWTSGSTIVTFVQSPSDASVWLAQNAQQILPGAGDKPSRGLQVSWDNAGRLAAIADQASLDSSGQATRQAHFYYGGDSQCSTPSDSGLVTAPSGYLCAFENLDGSRAEVYYQPLVSSFGAVQLGQVVLPGDAIWNFEWQTAEYTLSDNTQITAPQLLNVQTPNGHDAAKAGTVADADSRWWVVYDPFFGDLQGFVSPLPGVGAAANERIGRHYTLASGSNPGSAQIAWGNISGTAPNFSLSAGALLQQVGFDTAWRRTSLETVLDGVTSYTVTSNWDPNIDQQISTTYANASQNISYDFLGRPATLTGPGNMVSTTHYDQDNLAGWIATVYDNTTLAAPGVTSESINSADVNWTSLPNGVTSDTWSLQLSTYLASPADGDSVIYRLSSDSDASATLWVNGQCDPEDTQTHASPDHGGISYRHRGGFFWSYLRHWDFLQHRGWLGKPGDPSGPEDSTSCGSDNTATTSAANATGDALNLVVQYVRNGTTVSTANPVTIQIEQQINGGNWTPLVLADLDPGYDLKTNITSSDTLSPGGAVVTLTRHIAWDNALFGTQAGVTYPGFNGNLVNVPGYEASYDPENNLWQRLISQTSASGSTYGINYWDNTAIPVNPVCSNTAGVNQAGKVSAFIYPDADTGTASGQSRQLVYDTAGRKVGLEIIPPGETSGVAGCLSYDARGRKLNGQIGSFDGYGAMGKSWAYSADNLTTIITHTYDNPAQAPACAQQASAPYTCIESRTADLLGRTVASTDVWGTTATVDYQIDPATGLQTNTTELTIGAFTSSTVLTSNRDGTPAALSRNDNAGSPVLSAIWQYDNFGRTAQIVTQSGGAEIITAAYSYDQQSRIDTLNWTRDGNPVAGNLLTLSPNSSRTLGESFTLGGTDYNYAYQFNTAGWLTDAELTSSGLVNTSWSYGYQAAGLGTNPDAYLNGNVTHYSVDNDTREFGYDYLDRIEVDDTGSTISHDQLGNLTGYGDTLLVYNQANQLIEADDGSLNVQFERTPDGDLIRKVSDDGSSATEIRYASGNLILDDSGTPTNQTASIGNLLVNLNLSDPNQSGYTVTSLQGGNALIGLDAVGIPQNLDAPSLYGPWGDVINPPAVDPARPNFGWQAGNQLESVAGLVLMGKRTYLPDLGRFTSLDPVYGGGINGYNYADNDPINNNDPNGTLSLNIDLNIPHIELSNETKKILIISGIAAGGYVATSTAIFGIYKLAKVTTPAALDDSTTDSTPSVESSGSDSFEIVPDSNNNGLIGSLDDIDLKVDVNPFSSSDIQKMVDRSRFVDKPTNNFKNKLDSVLEEDEEAFSEAEFL